MFIRYLRLITFILMGVSFGVSNVNADAEEVTPTFVGCHPNGVCYIGISPLAVSTICPNKGQIRFDITLAGSNAQYSAALAALMSGKKIYVKLTDVCLNDYPTPNWLHAVK